MKHCWAALVIVLSLGALVPIAAAAQGKTDRPAHATERSPGFELGQNYPNPFDPATTIPFTIGDPPFCTDGGREYHVTLRIYNVLAQLVAIPVLLRRGAGPFQPVVGLTLRCGSYTAYWNGNYLNTAEGMASGVYLYRIEVDRRAVVKKMILMR